MPDLYTITDGGNPLPVSSQVDVQVFLDGQPVMLQARFTHTGLEVTVVKGGEGTISNSATYVEYVNTIEKIEQIKDQNRTRLEETP